MTETPRLTPAAEAARLARLAAEAEALRANLRRRKAQARARAGAETPSSPPDSAGSHDAPLPSHNRPETS
ncbi:hypothetical protein [Acetobacter conturbans]|uniref:Uncharacterized protein n=1 Tax=Acetobacter conturbans TaxID=1737472 RepID=A0ABX0JZ49_9PROT|nr:hypothetical protein [Acetobacter conturbans]NHN88152.1 hypothetical protein [Acetobacter conturbans]